MKTTQEIYKIIEENLGFSGRMITGSKFDYNRRNPDHIVVFNANIFVDGLNPAKVWYGDIDVTKDSPILYGIAREIRANIYILREQDGRFDKEDRKDYKKVAVWRTYI